ncbi:MAG: hypothetical protein EOP56_10735 [Sphingobacteriales bacterium]|nr:MAG: hypothetical protein EOP56_10735 [Sphingobacteriales bacterium]
MKKIALTAASAIALMFSIASCDKAKDAVNPDVPKIDTPKTSTGPTPYAPTIAGVDGALIAISMKYKVEQMGINVDVASEIGTAILYDGSRSNIVDGGTVTLNSVNLEKQTNNSYNKMATAGMTPSDMDMDGGASWNVAGNSSTGIPAFSYNFGSNFPSYTETLPSSITKANGISFNFNSNTVKNADSVYVAIITNSKQVIKSYAANAGSVTISASDLSSLPAISDKTAYLEVLPIKMTIRSFSNKEYVFIKEQAIVSSININ